MIMPRIRIFSTPTCPYCVTLEEYLKDKGFEFEKIDVSQDQKALDEMAEKSGQMGVPVVEIDGQIIVGFDKEKINEILKIR